MTQKDNIGDWSSLFRSVSPRSLDDIDVLIQRRENLRYLVGYDRAREIELDPDQVYNHEKWRILQGKAARRSLIFAVLAPSAVCFALAPGQPYKVIQKNKALYLASIGASFAVGFPIIHRLMGYSNEGYNEFQYAKYVKMLRNAQIRQ